MANYDAVLAAFKQYDSESVGTISIGDFRTICRVLSQQSMPDDDVIKLLEAGNLNNGTEVSYLQLLSFIFEVKEYVGVPGSCGVHNMAAGRRDGSEQLQMAGEVPSSQPQSAEGFGDDGNNDGFKRQITPNWTPEKGDALQDSVDLIFGGDGKSLLGLEFSFTIADPFLDGCPLIGCSTGFSKLCGYELDHIVGRNCRFLVDPVPLEKQHARMRKYAKEFCEAVRLGKEYAIPEAEMEDWMPRGRPGDELLCMQVNARQDGSLFNNMFFMKVFEIGGDLGEERPYIVALQSELPEGTGTLLQLSQNLHDLGRKMDTVKAELAGTFYMQCSMTRDMQDALSGA